MEERQGTSERPDDFAGIDKEIEPSSFEQRRSSWADARAEDLHVCPACHSELVYPTAWEPARDKHWSVGLRCPECSWNGGGVYGQALVDRFDDVLDRGTAALLNDLKALWRANLEDEIDRFVAALEADQILPEDF